MRAEESLTSRKREARMVPMSHTRHRDELSARLGQKSSFMQGKAPHSHPVLPTRSDTEPGGWVQGYLTHKKTHPPRTLP